MTVSWSLTIFDDSKPHVAAADANICTFLLLPSCLFPHHDDGGVIVIATDPVKHAEARTARDAGHEGNPFCQNMNDCTERVLNLFPRKERSEQEEIIVEEREEKGNEFSPHVLDFEAVQVIEEQVLLLSPAAAPSLAHQDVSQ